MFLAAPARAVLPPTEAERWLNAELWDAIGNGDADGLALLINGGADVNAKRGGYTPLHGAAINDSLSVATLLINNGADINAKSEYEDTPLYYAKSDEMKALLSKRQNRRTGAGTGNRNSPTTAVMNIRFRV